MKDAVNLLVEMAICMVNGGGGTVVFGVNDKVVGKANAVLGVPPEVDINRLKSSVYASTDPKLTPYFEELSVPEGSGRLIIMHVFPGLPPYTDTSGKGKVRVGKECLPLTGTLRRRIAVETGESDLTLEEISENPRSLLSPSAMERLRGVARRERASEELLKLSDFDLLGAVGLIRNGHLTKGGLLLVGKEDTLKEKLPNYVWTHLQMRSETDYTNRLDGRESLSVALERITDRIMVDNPLTTVEYGLFHFEYRTYPEIALREALLNAFCHADYRIPGPIIVKQYRRKIEISNPGGFIGGISPDNILHRQPVARNPHLVDALTRLRLVNRSNLGIARMFTALLIEGKEPPLITEQGESVKVTFLASKLSPAFRAFIANEGKEGKELTVDHLLIIQYLLRHPEIDAANAARICQRREAEIREVLSEMELVLGYLERGGAGRGAYWVLRPDLHRYLSAPGHPERDRRIDWEAAKTRILSILKQRNEKGEPGLQNSEIRQITHLDRGQVKRLMSELRDEGKVETAGLGRGSTWLYKHWE